MNNLKESYGSLRAQQYDNESFVDKGNREQHVRVLRDLTAFMGREKVVSYLELGCGTGYFSDVLVSLYPKAGATFIDGSSEMIERTKLKLGKHDKFDFRTDLLQNIDWAQIPKNDLTFSALTIHHLTDVEKNSLYDQIFINLNPGGWFIYFDQFKDGDEFTDSLYEYMACKDMEFRLRNGLPEELVIEELKIENIIEKDRAVKANENDKESLFINTLENLKKSGFSVVKPIYQEYRFWGIIAIK